TTVFWEVLSVFISNDGTSARTSGSSALPSAVTARIDPATTTAPVRARAPPRTICLRLIAVLLRWGVGGFRERIANATHKNRVVIGQFVVFACEDRNLAGVIPDVGVIPDLGGFAHLTVV